jgi:uncharacterized delta-60 repeat protein
MTKFYLKNRLQVSQAPLYVALISGFLLSTFTHAQQVDGQFAQFAQSSDFANSWINDIKVEGSGQITVAGYYQGRTNPSDRIRQAMIVRLNGSDGSIRTDFGAASGGGALVSYLNSFGTPYGNNAIRKVESSTGGFFILAGEYNSNSTGYIAKTTEGGSRPSAFNGGSPILPEGFGVKSYVEEMIVSGTNMWVARYSGPVGLGGEGKVIVAQYNSTTGQLVPGFGNGGEVVLPIPPEAAAGTPNGIKMIRMPDGGLHVAYTTGTYVILSKLLGNGQPDPDFFITGHTMFPSLLVVTSLSVYENGDVLVGGKGFNESANLPTVGFITFRKNGTLLIVSNNPQFPLGTSMEASMPAGGATDPSIIAAGSKVMNGKTYTFIQKYNPDDTADHLTVTPWLKPGYISAIPTAIANYYNQYYLVAANMIGPNEDTVAVVLRYHLDGTLDESFGQNGASYLYAIAAGQGWGDVIQFPDGKYLGGGNLSYYAPNPGMSGMVFNKFLPDGTPDSSFGENGRLYTYLYDRARTATKLHALSDGSFYVFGTYYTGFYGNTASAAVYKFLPDGSPDGSFGDNGVRWVGNLDWSDYLVTDTAIYIAGSNGPNAKSQVTRIRLDGTADKNYLMGLRFYDAFGINPNSGSVFIGIGYTAGVNAIYKSMEDASVDSDFGEGGSVPLTLIPEGTTSSPCWVEQIKTNNAGVIMVVRRWQPTSGATGPTRPQAIYFNWITPDGKVDSSNALGTKKLEIPNATSVTAERYRWVENGQKLLIFGHAVVDGVTKGMIAKVNWSGELDTGFGTDGVIWTSHIFTNIFNFDRRGDLIRITNNGLLGGSYLSKLEIPFTVYQPVSSASWTGAVSTDWFNAANWSDGKVPDFFTQVTIASGTCIIPPNRMAYAMSVTVLPGASFTVGENSTLMLTNGNP